MTRRTGSAGDVRPGVVRGSPRWVWIFAMFQLWAAVPSLVELYSEGVWRLLLTLPVAFVALMDAWHELRTPPCIGHGGSISPNHDEGEGIA